MTIRTVFDRRRLEVFLALTTFGFGLFLAVPFDSMAGLGYASLRAVAPEWVWAGIFIFNGLSHGLWLLVNGSQWWSPMMRWFAALFSALVYALWAAGFAYINPASTAVYTYSALSIGAWICCVYAYRDAVRSWGVHYARLAA